MCVGLGRRTWGVCGAEGKEMKTKQQTTKNTLRGLPHGRRQIVCKSARRVAGREAQQHNTICRGEGRQRSKDQRAAAHDKNVGEEESLGEFLVQGQEALRSRSWLPVREMVLLTSESCV